MLNKVIITWADGHKKIYNKSHITEHYADSFRGISRKGKRAVLVQVFIEESISRVEMSTILKTFPFIVQPTVGKITINGELFTVWLDNYKCRI